MRTALAITKREMKTYFNSPIAYIVIGVFLLVAGYLFFSTLFLMGRASLRGFFGIAPVLFVVFGPAVTMRLIAGAVAQGVRSIRAARRKSRDVCCARRLFWRAEKNLPASGSILIGCWALSAHRHAGNDDALLLPPHHEPKRHGGRPRSGRETAANC